MSRDRITCFMIYKSFKHINNDPLSSSSETGLQCNQLCALVDLLKADLLSLHLNPFSSVARLPTLTLASLADLSLMCFVLQYNNGTLFLSGYCFKCTFSPQYAKQHFVICFHHVYKAIVERAWCCMGSRGIIELD